MTDETQAVPASTVAPVVATVEVPVTVTAVPGVATDTATVTTGTDALIAKVKEALIFSGHAVDDVWDEVVALAKKLA